MSLSICNSHMQHLLAYTKPSLPHTNRVSLQSLTKEEGILIVIMDLKLYSRCCKDQQSIIQDVALGEHGH